MTQRQTSQSGSIAAFLMVGIVLAGLVIGGVYLAHQRGEVARAGEPTPAPVAVHHENTSTNNTSSDQQQKTAEQEAADKKAAEQKAAQQKADEQAAADKKAAEQKAADQKAAEQEAAQAPTAVATVPQTGRVAAPETADQLPVTGPADGLLQVLAGGILIGGVIAYLRSYRYRFGSLFR